MSSVQLYPHDPGTLLPLLRAHLPNSLPVYGCILSNHSSSPTSPSSPRGTLEPLSKLETHSHLRHAYATFPPSALPPPSPAHRTPFVVLIHLPPPAAQQIRLFCSAETRPGVTDAEREDAAALVTGAVGAHLAGEGGAETRMIGGMAEAWCERVRRTCGTRERDTCDVWLAPDPLEGEGDAAPALTVGADDGLAVDVGRRHDIELARPALSLLPRIRVYGRLTNRGWLDSEDTRCPRRVGVLHLPTPTHHRHPPAARAV